jgi:hypothetical protein
MKNLKFILMAIVLMGVLASCERDFENLEVENPAEVAVDSSSSKLKAGSACANYDAMTANGYALMWTDNSGSFTDASSYNPRYKYWNTNGNSDCANFVSQCLKAGNLQDDPYGNWYYKMNGTVSTGDDNYSTAWQRADELYDYLYLKYDLKTIVAYNFSSVYQNRNSIYHGDLVFYMKSVYQYVSKYGRYMWVTKAKHVTIVTGKTSIDILISGHTSNNKNASLRSYLLSGGLSNNGYDYLVIMHFN